MFPVEEVVVITIECAPAPGGHMNVQARMTRTLRPKVDELMHEVRVIGGECVVVQSFAVAALYSIPDLHVCVLEGPPQARLSFRP